MAISFFMCRVSVLRLCRSFVEVGGNDNPHPHSHGMDWPCIFVCTGLFVCVSVCRACMIAASATLTACVHWKANRSNPFSVLFFKSPTGHHGLRALCGFSLVIFQYGRNDPKPTRVFFKPARSISRTRESVPRKPFDTRRQSWVFPDLTDVSCSPSIR